MAELNPALLMFHQVRKDTQILLKLEEKCNEYHIRVSSTSAAVCAFALWKVGSVLIFEEKMYYIGEIQLISHMIKSTFFL